MRGIVYESDHVDEHENMEASSKMAPALGPPLLTTSLVLGSDFQDMDLSGALPMLRTCHDIVNEDTPITELWRRGTFSISAINTLRPPGLRHRLFPQYGDSNGL